uniref:Uncharacterized protein n=1 Tax=Arundo donax TaxID=35708 RepID=A0A0A9GCX3_ARUDO
MAHTIPEQHMLPLMMSSPTMTTWIWWIKRACRRRTLQPGRMTTASGQGLAAEDDWQRKRELQLALQNRRIVERCCSQGPCRRRRLD